MAPYKNAERIKQSSQEGFYKIHSPNENRRQPSKGNAQREQRRNARSTDIQCTGARILAPSLGRVTQHPWGSPHPPPARRRASPRSSAGTVLAVPRQADAGTAPLAVPPPGGVLGGCSSRPTGLSVPSSAAASGREGGDPSGLGGGGRGTRTQGGAPPPPGVAWAPHSPSSSRVMRLSTFSSPSAILSTADAPSRQREQGLLGGGGCGDGSAFPHLHVTRRFGPGSGAPFSLGPSPHPLPCESWSARPRRHTREINK